MIQGLTRAEAQKRLTANGYNELPSAKPRSLWGIVLEVIQEPMFLLLISCGVLYVILGDYREGMILSSSILLIIAITFYQYRKTERALEALRNLSSPRALVIRDGKEQRISGREVVNGDLLVLLEGDRIAADAVLIEAHDLLVDESLLSGESVPVAKSAGAGDELTVGNPGGENETGVFSGTMILRGSGFARVLSTGTSTWLGRIGVSLQTQEQPQTRLQTEMKKTIRRLGLAGIALSLLVVISFYLTRADLISALLTGLSSAMAILPEEFPVVMTIFLALGAWRLSQRQVLTRTPAAIETLGAATVLCSDKTGTITENRMTVTAWSDGNVISPISSSSATVHTLKLAAWACPDKPVDPMDKAILKAAGQTGDFTTIDFTPFSRETLYVSRIVQANGQTTAAVKGAPEAILKLCKCEPEQHRILDQKIVEMASGGLRVLGIAEGKPAGSGSYDFSFSGFLGLEDPIRPEVHAAMEECRRAGVHVIMITGDYPVTAASIGKRIGLNADELVTGEQLEKLDNGDLAEAIRKTTIFARVVPEQKLRIVRALQANGEVVAMTGDGVNDAPALKAANIGVSMGLKGTDVAREASALVVLDDNFASIVQAIRLGRRIYDNLQKAMMYILAIHIPIIGLSLLPAFVPSLPILLFPLHIVFMELIIDPVCSIAFENEPGEAGLMERPPRKPDEPFLGSRAMLRGLTNGLLMLAMVIAVYFLSLNEGHTAGEVRLIAFSSLILVNIGFILSSLSRTRYVLQVLGEHNPAVKYILGSALVVLSAIVFVPGLRSLFAFELPGLEHLLPGILGGLAVVTVLEGLKMYRIRSQKLR